MVDLHLSDRERIFVLEYAKTDHGVNSATAAGYGSPHVTATKVLKRQRIIDAIAIARKNPNDKALFVQKTSMNLPAMPKLRAKKETKLKIFAEKPQTEPRLKVVPPLKEAQSAVIEHVIEASKEVTSDKSAPEIYMESLVADEFAHPRLRFEAAKALLPYRCAKPAEIGKKEEKEDAAKKAGGGKFGAIAAPPAPPAYPPLRLVSGFK